MPFSPPRFLSKQLVLRNSTSKRTYTWQDRRNWLAVDIETNEAFPDRETNPTDFDKLEGYNPNRPRICSPRSSRAWSTRGQENEAWALYKKKSSREFWGDLSGHRYIICPKPPHPAEKILNRRQLFFLAVPPWAVIKRLCPSRTTVYSAPGAGPQKVYQTSIGQVYKGKGNNNEGGFTKLKTSKR